MRFVSKSPRYLITYKREIVKHFDSGDTEIIQPWWNCQFTPDTWRPWERDFALNHFINRGLPVEEDGMTTVDPTYRFSTFDTVEFQRRHENDYPKPFTDEDRVKMEQFLLANEDHGPWYHVVETPAVPKPWPTYDDTPYVDVATVAAATGTVQEALTYELSREDGGRPHVIAGLEHLLQPVEDVPDEELVAA